MKAEGFKSVVAKISAATGLPECDISDALRAYHKVVESNFRDGISTVTRGFGTFLVVRRKSKVARNIKTKTELIIPERNHLKFRPYFKPKTNV